MSGDYWAPIVQRSIASEDVEPTSKTIQRVSTMLSVGATLDDIRSNLLTSGLTEYQVFLAVKAGEFLSGLQAFQTPIEQSEQGECIFCQQDVSHAKCDAG